jgi:D-aspartate ligase
MSAGAVRNRVLVLGSGITLLGVLRALSVVDADVFALPDTEDSPRRSRWFRSAPAQLAGLKPSGLQEALEKLPGPTVLMPASDAWVKAVSALPAAVLKRYPASVAPVDAVDVLIDKNRFRETLSRLHLPHPKTQILTSIADLPPSSSLRASFLKPAGSQEFFARFGVKAFRVADRAEAEARLATCIQSGFQMMLQEYIPGPPTNHYFLDGFVDRSGVVRARFARRRLRMSPPDFGNSTLMESIPVSQTGTAASTLDTLFAALRYRGIFSAEFKRDERDGEFNLIEVNARPWWYVEFAARCGINVCEMAVQDALGQPVETVSRYAVGRRCVFPSYDLDAVRAEIAAGRLNRVTAARSWLGAYQPIFRWSDPLPAVSDFAKMVRRRLIKST